MDSRAISYADSMLMPAGSPHVDNLHIDKTCRYNYFKRRYICLEHE